MAVVRVLAERKFICEVGRLSVRWLEVGDLSFASVLNRFLKLPDLVLEFELQLQQLNFFPESFDVVLHVLNCFVSWLVADGRSHFEFLIYLLNLVHYHVAGHVVNSLLQP